MSYESYQIQKVDRSGHYPGEAKVPKLQSRFIGRVAELKQLKEIFLTCREKTELQAATLIGASVTGKSRLALEFCRSVRAAFSFQAWGPSL